MLVVDDVVVSVDEPSCGVDSSEVLVDPMAVSILEDDWFVSFVIVEVTKALVWAEIVFFKPIWKWELNLVSCKTHQLVAFEQDIKGVLRSDAAVVLVNEIAFLVDCMAVVISEVVALEDLVSVPNFAVPVTSEVSDDLILVKEMEKSPLSDFIS